ncbi:MAG: hypothetical protein QW097_02130, partial [archaeon]
VEFMSTNKTTRIKRNGEKKEEIKNILRSIRENYEKKELQYLLEEKRRLEKKKAWSPEEKKAKLKLLRILEEVIGPKKLEAKKQAGTFVDKEDIIKFFKDQKSFLEDLKKEYSNKIGNETPNLETMFVQDVLLAIYKHRKIDPELIKKEILEELEKKDLRIVRNPKWLSFFQKNRVFFDSFSKEIFKQGKVKSLEESEKALKDFLISEFLEKGECPDLKNLVSKISEKFEVKVPLRHSLTVSEYLETSQREGPKWFIDKLREEDSRLKKYSKDEIIEAMRILRESSVDYHIDALDPDWIIKIIQSKKDKSV